VPSRVNKPRKVVSSDLPHTFAKAEWIGPRSSLAPDAVRGNTLRLRGDSGDGSGPQRSVGPSTRRTKSLRRLSIDGSGGGDDGSGGEGADSVSDASPGDNPKPPRKKKGKKTKLASSRKSPEDLVPEVWPGRYGYCPPHHPTLCETTLIS